MLSIQDRLLVVEDDFVRALAQGEQAVTSFEERWEALMKDVDEASASTGLATETATLVYTTASRIAVLAEASAALYTTYDDLTSCLVDDLDSLMSELNLHDSSTATVPPPRDTWQPRPQVQRHSSPDTMCKKRRRCSVDDDDSYDTRKRQSTPSNPRNPEVTIMCPTCPAPNVCPFPEVGPLSKSTPVANVTSGARRKRRLSETALEPCLHPAKRLYAGPRLHAVSDSFVNARGPSSGADALFPERDALASDLNSFAPFDIQPLCFLSWSPTSPSDSSSEASFGNCSNGDFNLSTSLDVGGLNDIIDPLIFDTEPTIYDPLVPHAGDSDSNFGSDAGIRSMWFSSSSLLTESVSPSSSSSSSPILTPKSLSPNTAPLLQLVPLDLTDPCCVESLSTMVPPSPHSVLQDVAAVPFHSSYFDWRKQGAAFELPVRVDDEPANDTLDSLLHWLSTTPLPGDPKSFSPTALRSLTSLDTPESDSRISLI